MTFGRKSRIACLAHYLLYLKRLSCNSRTAPLCFSDFWLIALRKKAWGERKNDGAVVMLMGSRICDVFHAGQWGSTLRLKRIVCVGWAFMPHQLHQMPDAGCWRVLSGRRRVGIQNIAALTLHPVIVEKRSPLARGFVFLRRPCSGRRRD